MMTCIEYLERGDLRFALKGVLRNGVVEFRRDGASMKKILEGDPWLVWNRAIFKGMDFLFIGLEFDGWYN